MAITAFVGAISNKFQYKCFLSLGTRISNKIQSDIYEK